MRRTQRFATARSFIALLMVALLTVFQGASVATAQENPIGRNSFTSPKYGTEIEWSRDWIVDRDQSALEQSRDILFLTGVNIDAIVFVELRSQRAFRTAEQALDGFMTRLSSESTLTITEDNSAEYPPNLAYEQGRKGEEVLSYIQAQFGDTAMVVSAIVTNPGEQDEAIEIARSTITIDGVSIFDFKPVCDASSESTSSTSLGGNKTGSLGSAATPVASNDCVTVATPTANTTPVPTPTPTGGGKSTSLTSETYQAQTFDVSFEYDAKVWEIADDLAADENNGRDTVQLNNSTLGSFVVVEAYEGHGGKASTCIDLSLREWGILPGTNEVLTDRDGKDLVGSTRGRVWGAYAFTFTDMSTESENELDLNAYVECRAMPGAKGVVVITLISQPGDFLDSYDALQPILSSLRIG